MNLQKVLPNGFNALGERYDRPYAKVDVDHRTFEYVRKREIRERYVAAVVQRQPSTTIQRVAYQILVSEHHAFWLTGRAGRVQQRCKIFSGCGLPELFKSAGLYCARFPAPIDQFLQ